MSSRPRTPNRPKTPTRIVSGASLTQPRPLTPQPRPVTPSRPLTPVVQRPPPIATNGQHLHALEGHSASLGRTATSPHTASLGRTASPPTASLGRSASQSSHSGGAGLKRNSLNDLKRTPSLLGDHKVSLTTLGENKPLDDGRTSDQPPHKSLEERKASVNTLGELKIPARISKAQQGLKRDLGMVREFAGCVEQLKRLQATYRKLIGELCVVYDSYPAIRPQSRPSSRLAGRSGSRLTSNPNPSTQSFVQTPGTQTSTSVPSPRKSSFSRASNDLHRELGRLEHEYGLWWECAELLVDLGGGTGAAAVAAGSVSNPNLSHHSSMSAFKAAADEVLGTTSLKRLPAHTPSKSDPGLLLLDPLQGGVDKGPPQASHAQWRASAGRNDLNPRQLQLLRDMLNTPDPANLVDSAETYGYSLGPDGFVYTSTDDQVWHQWNASCVTLPSEESSADMGVTVDPTVVPRKEKEKKHRISKLGILGLRDLLFGLKKKAVEEGRLPQRSESSLGSQAEVDDDFYNRRRSPWYQHEPHHAREVIEPTPPVVPIPSKSPRRPSLASIFRIGYKSSKHSGKKEEPPLSANQSNATGPDQLNDPEYADWEKMSRSDLDLPAIPSGMATVRCRKNANCPPTSFSSLNIGSHPYTYFDAATSKKDAAAASKTSLREPAQPALNGDSDADNKLARAGKHRTSSWSQAASQPPRSSSRNGRAPMSGTVRSAPPADLSISEPKLALTPENIKPLLEYAKEVGLRLTECISEVEGLLGVGIPPS